MTQATELPDGYYVVPAGKLANAVTWLEMRAPPAARLADPLRLRPVHQAERSAYRRLVTAVGTPWLWSCAATDATDQTMQDDHHIATDERGRQVGLVAFAGRAGRDVEIAYFGLVPEATGAGLGRRMMAAALDLAWTAADRVWLHTCNFDHPAALRFYRSCGFVPYATGFEIMDDARLRGTMPADAAPHVPLIRR